MIYYVQESGNPMAPIKIGYTDKDPQQRLAQMQTGYPGKLCVLFSCEGTERDEAIEHRKWNHLHIHGEWFRPGPDLLEHIASGAALAVHQRQVEKTNTLASHDFVEASGTTKICRNCGCVLFCCRCCTDGQRKYSRWLKGEWEEDVWKATATRPPCVSGRRVPAWLAKREPSEGGDR